MIPGIPEEARIHLLRQNDVVLTMNTQSAERDGGQRATALEEVVEAVTMQSDVRREINGGFSLESFLTIYSLTGTR